MKAVFTKLDEEFWRLEKLEIRLDDQQVERPWGLGCNNRKALNKTYKRRQRIGKILSAYVRKHAPQRPAGFHQVCHYII